MLAGKAVVVSGTLERLHARGGRGGDHRPRRQEPGQRERQDVRPRRRRQPRRQQGHQGREGRRADPRRGRASSASSRPASCRRCEAALARPSRTLQTRSSERPGVGAGRARARPRRSASRSTVHGVRARRRSSSIGCSSPGVNVSVALPGSNTAPGGTSICSPGSTSSVAEVVEADRRQRDAVDHEPALVALGEVDDDRASAASTCTASGTGRDLLDRRSGRCVDLVAGDRAGQREADQHEAEGDDQAGQRAASVEPAVPPPVAASAVGDSRRQLGDRRSSGTDAASSTRRWRSHHHACRGGRRRRDGQRAVRAPGGVPAIAFCGAMKSTIHRPTDAT